MLDRIDMIIEVPRERIEKILDKEPELDATNFREQVIHAQEMQKKRFTGYTYTVNAQIQAKDIQKLIPLSDETTKFFTHAVHSLNISPRLLHRIQKIARTIADLG